MTERAQARLSSLIIGSMVIGYCVAYYAAIGIAAWLSWQATRDLIFFN